MEASGVAGEDTEIGHTLFVDIVAFSSRPMEEQSSISYALRTGVQETPAYLRAQSAGDLVSLPTGDGMALVFFRNPLAPVQCATELARALLGAPFGVRMGIHSGPVARVRDINNQTNVTGSGINTAQRVMDCGESGHILLSSSAAEVVREFATWAPCLHSLGTIEVKHGVSLHLYNLVAPEVGNPTIPLRMQQSAEAASYADASLVPSLSNSLSTLPVIPQTPLPPAPRETGAPKRRGMALWLVIGVVLLMVLIARWLPVAVAVMLSNMNPSSGAGRESIHRVPHRVTP